MNNEFSQGEFSLDVGERLLEGMQSLRDELNTFGDQVQALTGRSQDIVPLKQRSQPVTRPLTVHVICNYKQNNVSFITILGVPQESGLGPLSFNTILLLFFSVRYRKG